MSRPRSVQARRAVNDEVRYLSDLSQIRELLARYGYLVDARQPRPLVEGAFTVDGVDNHGIYGKVFRGHDEIEAMFRRSNETTEASAHFIADPVIEIDGDVAYGRTYVTGWTWIWDSAPAGNVRPADWVFIGIYVDRFERTADGWLISERIIEPLGAGATAAGRRPGAYGDPPWAGGTRNGEDGPSRGE